MKIRRKKRTYYELSRQYDFRCPIIFNVNNYLFNLLTLGLKTFHSYLFLIFCTKVLAKGTIHSVSDCPRNKTEWQRASSRLNCSDDFTNVRNKYHCLPTDSLTTLVEFCYSRIRYHVTTGKLYLNSIIYRRALLFIEAKYQLHLNRYL